MPYEDDPTIVDEAALWRRIPPWHIYFDENLGRRRPSSAAFDDDPDGPMSVVIAAESRGPDSVLAGHDGYGLASLTAGFARGVGQGVARDPTEEEPAHALVFGRKTRRVRNKLVSASAWVVLPPEAEGPPR